MFEAWYFCFSCSPQILLCQYHQMVSFHQPFCHPCISQIKWHNLRTSVLNMTLYLEIGVERLYVIIAGGIGCDMTSEDCQKGAWYKSFITTLEFKLHGCVHFRFISYRTEKGIFFISIRYNNELFTPFSIKHKKQDIFLSICVL